MEEHIQRIIDGKTKPLGALGMLETLAKQICLIQQSLTPQLRNPSILVFAADHGISHEGVSAYPQEVTAQMVKNFAHGGAAINVFCRQHNIKLEVVDVGVNFDFDRNLPIQHHKIAYGAASSLTDPALSMEQLSRCREVGTSLVRAKKAADCNIIGFGEMGIGNTSSAALLLHFLEQIPVEECVGSGTGITEAQLEHKRAVLTQVTQTHSAIDTSDPEAVLAAVGGLEIASMCYAMLEAAEQNMLILVDGFISSAAALVAKKLNPRASDNMVFCHQSAEQGHRLMLERLGAIPLLNLDLRLGEGSACALAFPLVQSAVDFFNDMASFDSAGVSEKNVEA